MYICPCCGYNKLKVKPYKNMPNPPVSTGLTPPYDSKWGEPSYDVCDCCGFEYGNDDNPGTSSPSSFQGHLKEWYNEGCNWEASSLKPKDWDLINQLKSSQIPLPDFLA